jgi:histone arginine demethylase JMJD6
VRNTELKLDQWTQHGYAWCRSEWDGEGAPENIERIDQSEVSEAEFIERFEKPALPCLIRGSMDRLGTKEKWTREKLSEKYGGLRFKVGEDDEGYPVKMRLKYFFTYMEEQRDDCPLYVFDHFGDHEDKKELLKDYEVPKYFRDDLFAVVGEDRRPPYRWLIIGPERSGSGIHIDPLGTSAWNALLYGHKRWVLFPPSIAKEVVAPRKGHDRGGISWFMHMYQQTKKPDWKGGKPIEFIQQPGETVFVPGGWHHTVLNIDDTVAVTQNFCSKTNFRLVWPRTVRGRPKLSVRMRKELGKKFPDVAAHADTIDCKARDELPPDSTSDSSSSSSTTSDGSDAAEDRERVKKMRKTKKDLDVKMQGGEEEEEHDEKAKKTKKKGKKKKGY